MTRASRNGQAYSSANVTPASRTPGKKGLGISKPKARISQPGMIRSAPSSQPMYQSGWLAVDTSAGSNGPYTQMGLIWNTPPRNASTPEVRKNNPSALNA